MERPDQYDCIQAKAHFRRDLQEQCGVNMAALHSTVEISGKTVPNPSHFLAKLVDDLGLENILM